MNVRKVALLLLALLIAGSAWQRDALMRVWRRTTGPVPAPLIMVYPLESSGEEPYFGNGLTEDLVARLGQTPGLKVFGRSGASRFKAFPLQTVASTLDVSAALTGTASRSGDRVTLTLELIAVKDQASFWAGRFSGDMKDIVAIETRAAGEVAGALRVEHTPTASDARALSRKVDPRAYDLHLRGQDALASLHATEALTFFAQAAAADPTLVEALAGIVVAARDVNVNEGIPDDPGRTAQVRAAAAQASQLDPDFPPVNLAMGLASASLDEALDSLKGAIDRDPTYARALEALGDEVRDADPDRALAFYGRALVADPFLETAHINNAATMLLLNRWGLALGELLRIEIELAPPWSLGMFPVFDFAKDSYRDALADLMLKTPPLRERPYFLAQLVETLALSRKTAEALEEATALTARFPDFCEGHALLAAVLTDAGKPAEARQVAQPIIAAAEGANARVSQLRCAATATAGLGDGEHTAAILDRILSNESLLRSWSFARFGQSGRLLLMGHMYPWRKIVDLPRIAGARARFDTTFEQQRADIRAKLGPVAYQ